MAAEGVAAPQPRNSGESRAVSLPDGGGSGGLAERSHNQDDTVRSSSLIMSKNQLQAEHRALFGKKTKQLRRKGVIPIVVYGPEVDPLSLQVDERDLWHTISESGGTQLIKLEVQPHGATYTTLAREVQTDPITRKLLHVDFQAVIMDQIISAAIPLAYEGEPLPVQEGVGVLVQNLDSVTVEALPMNLPANITVDLSTLMEVGQKLTVADLSVSADAQVLTDLGEWVAQVVPIRVALEEEEVIVEDAESETGEVAAEGERERHDAQEQS